MDYFLNKREGTAHTGLPVNLAEPQSNLNNNIYLICQNYRINLNGSLVAVARSYAGPQTVDMHMESMGEMRNAYKILVRKQEGSLGKSGCVWEGDIKMNLKEIGFESVDCFYLDQNVNNLLSLVNMGINFSFHKLERISCSHISPHLITQLR